MKKLTFILLVLAFASCKKETQEDPDPIVAGSSSNYSYPDLVGTWEFMAWYNTAFYDASDSAEQRATISIDGDVAVVYEWAPDTTYHYEMTGYSSHLTGWGGGFGTNYANQTVSYTVDADTLFFKRYNPNALPLADTIMIKSWLRIN